MQLLGHDYVSDTATAHSGLAGIATLVEQARTEAEAQNRACILLDNGDTLQGNVMGDMLSQHPVDAAHPVVASINAMGYDVIGIGNHDLDYGLPYLESVARQLKMPVISSNLEVDATSALKRAAMVHCAGLRVGVLSALPAKTAIWNRHVLEGAAKVTPAPQVLRQAAQELRAQGADLVVVLAHMGIGGGTHTADDDALSLAQISEIDAIITGHTHRRFPGADHANRTDRGIDADMGTLAKRPAIMPGYAGSDLAVLDLTVGQTPGGGWQVIDHTSSLRPNTAETQADTRIVDLCAPAHHATRAYLSATVGQLDHGLHNFFSLAMPTSVAALVARAKARLVRDALAGTDDANLPLLASVAAHTAGGRGGPDNFLCIAKGAVLRRHIAGLSPYTNQIWALRVTGADIREMLEQSATVFRRLVPDAPDQMLRDSQVPAFNFDTIFGLTYRIDPTQPIGQRIRNPAYQGQILAPDDRFILATNQFRAAGGGGFKPFECKDVVHRSAISPDAALIDTLAHPDDMIWPSQVPWSFGCDLPTQAMLHSNPAALERLDEIAHLAPEPCGVTSDGFARLRLTL